MHIYVYWLFTLGWGILVKWSWYILYDVGRHCVSFKLYIFYCKSSISFQTKLTTLLLLFSQILQRFLAQLTEKHNHRARSHTSTSSPSRMIPFINGSRWPHLSPLSAPRPVATRLTYGRDMLTSLPNDHLYEILRRLPIKDVVRTSTLAKAWRN
jgi:hypothetical protein